MLPDHGFIRCRRCYKAKGEEMCVGRGSPPAWRLEATSAAWGSATPKVMVLGFSKGQRQSQRLPLEKVPFAGMWPKLTKILRRLSVIEPSDTVERHFRADELDLHFGSLIRCSVAMWDPDKEEYRKSGGQILERFLKDPDCRPMAETCARTYLGSLSERTRLVLMLGNSDEYVDRCMELMGREHPDVRRLNAVSYGNDQVTWVHALHPAAQGSYLKQWLDAMPTTVGRKLAPAIDGIRLSGALDSSVAEGRPAAAVSRVSQFRKDLRGDHAVGAHGMSLRQSTLETDHWGGDDAEARPRQGVPWNYTE